MESSSQNFQDDSFETSFEESPPKDIIAFNELRSCADLFRMHEDGDLDISPAYQRDIVWKGSDQTRFIDSLIKGLPIPSLCFSYDYVQEKWSVIDGLQRMASIIRFLEKDSDWTLSNIGDVNESIRGAPISEFQNPKSTLYKLWQRVKNTTIPITVIRCDPSKEDHSNYIFTIFHRLNSGGTKLTNQEIRNCIFSGGLNDLLKELDLDKAWKKIHKLGVNNRLKSQEMILRFFAYHDALPSYTKQGLGKFLNFYMQEHRNPPTSFIFDHRSLFLQTINLIQKKMPNALDGRISNAVIEAVLFGISKNIDGVTSASPSKVLKAYKLMLNSDAFSTAQIQEGLANPKKLSERLRVARASFQI
jgi:Protein of unknown function DUF262